MCFNPIEDDSIHSLLFKNSSICYRCFSRFKPKLKGFKVDDIKGYYIYDYDEEVQKNLYQFKGCFDIELSNIFLEYFVPYLRFKYFGYVVVPAPSSNEADNERGFNHVIEIFKSLKLPIERCIYKTENIKQSSLSAEERKNVKNILKIHDVNLRNKKVLIVDDVFTTGSTVRAMINLIQSKRPKTIKVLVMSKTKDIEKPVS